MIARLLAVAAALSLSGCLATVTRDGFVLYERDTTLSIETVKRRASFEMSCAPEQLTVVVLNTYPGGDMANQVGVSGCGQKLVYMRLPGNNWALNGQTAKAD